MKKYEVEFADTMYEERAGYEERVEADSQAEAVLLFIDWLRDHGDANAENHIYWVREYREWDEEPAEWVIDPHK